MSIVDVKKHWHLYVSRVIRYSLCVLRKILTYDLCLERKTRRFFQPSKDFAKLINTKRTVSDKINENYD